MPNSMVRISILVVVKSLPNQKQSINLFYKQMDPCQLLTFCLVFIFELKVYNNSVLHSHWVEKFADECKNKFITTDMCSYVLFKTFQLNCYCFVSILQFFSR